MFFRRTLPMTASAGRPHHARLSVLSLVGGLIAGLAAVSPFAAGAAMETLVSKEIFDKWMTVCAQESETGPKSCFAAQSVNVKQGNQVARLIEVQVKPIRDSQESMSLVVNLPLGIYLPSSAKARIDEGPEIGLQLLTCTQAGCLSAAKIGKNIVEAMRRGRELTVGFIPQGSARTNLIRLPLDGFSRALAKALSTK